MFLIKKYCVILVVFFIGIKVLAYSLPCLFLLRPSYNEVSKKTITMRYLFQSDNRFFRGIEITVSDQINGEYIFVFPKKQLFQFIKISNRFNKEEDINFSNFLDYLNKEDLLKIFEKFEPFFFKKIETDLSYFLLEAKEAKHEDISTYYYKFTFRHDHEYSKSKKEKNKFIIENIDISEIYYDHHNRQKKLKYKTAVLENVGQLIQKIIILPQSLKRFLEEYHYISRDSILEKLKDLLNEKILMEAIQYSNNIEKETPLYLDDNIYINVSDAIFHVKYLKIKGKFYTLENGAFVFVIYDITGHILDHKTSRQWESESQTQMGTDSRFYMPRRKSYKMNTGGQPPLKKQKRREKLNRKQREKNKKN